MNYIDKIVINDEERDINGIKLVPITYSELVTLRDTNKLTPGMQYRITDYVCTVANDPEARAISHPFDIIVTADTTSTLNENARACLHNRDNPYETDYYRDAFSALSTSDYDLCSPKRFIDSVGGRPGKYVFIKENIDYWRTEDGAYDFNGQSMELFGIDMQDPEGYMGNVEIYVNVADLSSWELKYSLDNNTTRFAWADTVNGKGVIYWMKDDRGNECPYDFKQIQFKRYKITECAKSPDLEGRYSAIAKSPDITIDKDSYIWCYTFSCYVVGDDEIVDASVRQYGLTDDEGINRRCYDNKIMPYYSDEDYEKLAVIEKLGNNVFYGVFDESDGNYNSMRSNTFGNDCSYNTFGNDCSSNTFGNGCSSNTFGNDCSYNTFGNNCSSNTFGNNCYTNTFGNSCYTNTFGNDCSYNTFGNSCSYNTFGNNCSYNMFSVVIHFVNLVNNSSRSHVLSGTSGTQINPIVVDASSGLTYCTYVGKNSAGVVKMWAPADLVQ